MAAARLSIESEASGPFRMFGRKRSQEDAKKELDLASALPPTDDFRTSLLMTGLSARFSMLREQDDPNSKLGKASDDSVLFPKRQSRLADFGLGAGLHDIAEVESIRAPPFSRFDSYNSSDDAASTSGSIMNRSKPTDGNNLFGGRQKIYKIPAGGSARNGGMGGRALYGDDVAQSAFQKWRQSERERHSLDENETGDTNESDGQVDFSRRRETNSTTSSAPSAARNSTAATSIASSQPSSSVKDWSSGGTAMASSTQLPHLERSVTRTRRLYEQGLNQDLQDQQSSAVSRMDTLSRQRPFGTRTPDLTPPVPSPTNATFGDRVLERRPIMSKASAPNLRSFSPPASSTPISPAESSSNFPRPEPKPAFVASPPLSPPISETGEHPMLPIQPNDRGKATAMGVFARPAQQYDDFKYAQRQRQLQQGRETPSGRGPADTGMAMHTSRSRSSSSHRQPINRDGFETRVPESVAEAEDGNPTFFDESDDASVDNRSSIPSVTPQLIIERPDDEAHPAFRKSALPTPLSLTSPRFPDHAGGLSGSNEAFDRGVDPPEDSPTLGPNSGLSGMVRQHLRQDSSASSICGTIEQPPVSAPLDNPQSRASQGSESSKLSMEAPAVRHPAAPTDATPEEQDDFARHLADGARRVRERLTTYVESDNERSTPTTPLSESRELPVPRSSGLGILRSKSSRGSLFDRESRERSRSKSSKSRVPDSSNRTTSPSPRKPSTESTEQNQRDGNIPDEDGQASRGSPTAEKDEPVHAGLKAFRQARRELQRMKEIETQQRHQAPPKQLSMPERPSPHRVISHENGPPPVMFNRMPRDESRSRSRSRAGSRAASERERSGSETSTASPAYTRATRLRNGSLTYDEQYGGHAPPAGFPRQGPMHGGLPIDPSGRRVGRMRELSDPKIGSPVHTSAGATFESLPYARSRSGSMLSAAASTPNLHAVANAHAPPLPPINPRRKNGQGFGHRGDEGAANGYGGTMSDEEGAQSSHRHGGHRMVLDASGRLRQSPPRGPPTIRPPLPHPSMSSGNLPGGMI